MSVIMTLQSLLLSMSTKFKSKNNDNYTVHNAIIIDNDNKIWYNKITD
jgi:hypothetical protein